MTIKTKRIICLLIGIASILTIVSTISYAYFTAIADVTPVESVIGTANVSVKFADYGAEVGGSVSFGDSITKRFTIENTGTTEAKVKMYWNNLKNTYLEGSLIYTLSYSENEDGPYEEVIGKTNVPRSRITSKKELASSLTIPVDTTYYYSLVITLNNLPDVDQTPDLKAVFNSSFAVEDINYTVPVATASIKAVPSSSYTGEIWGYKSSIKKIVFEDALIPKESYAYKFDISANNNGSVMSYLVKDTEDSSKYIAYIQGKNGVLANADSSYLFRNFTSLESIENLPMIDTSNVTDMYSMFYNCSSLTALDLRSFDTSKVTDMSYMFYDCSSLTALDLSSFDTSNVTNMSTMFYNCSSLTKLNLSNFDTSNVTNMQEVFKNCSNLTTLDISSFDTSNVTDMNEMLYNCSSLTELNLSSFDTSGVTDMSYMFQNCSSLTSLDLSNFDTSKVTNMRDMFYKCNELKKLDLSNFDTSNVTNMFEMFGKCNSLTTLNLSNFDTSNVTDMGEMFEYCYDLTNLDISSFDTSSVTNMYCMFNCCYNLTTTILIRGTKCTDYTYMFSSASTTSGKITVNYTADASSLVNNMINTKSSNSNVVKGSIVS